MYNLLLYFYFLVKVQVNYGCIPIPPRPGNGSSSSTDPPGQGIEQNITTVPVEETITNNHTLATEKATTSFIIDHNDQAYTCTFNFAFSSGEGIIINTESSSECSKTANVDDEMVDFLGQHDFTVTTLKGFDVICSLNAVFEETDEGIHLVDNVVRQSLKCLPSPGQCLTEDGPDFPNKCSFPFIYQDRIYQACTDWKDGIQGDRLWCATETRADQTMVLEKWSWCNSFCGYCGGKSLISATEGQTTTSTTLTSEAPGSCKTVTGNMCKFPFKDGANEYTVCAQYRNLYHWCAVTTNPDGSYAEWEKCDPKVCQLEGDVGCQTESGPDPHKTCVFPFKDGSTPYSSCAPYRSQFWCATSLNTDGTYKTWGYCKTDGTCPLASTKRSGGNSRSITECGYDCFLNTRKNMISFTEGLSQDLLLPPSPIVGKLTDSSWNILPGEKFQFLIGQMGVDLECPEGTTFSKFKGESRISVSCTGDYMFSVTGFTSRAEWKEEKNVHFGCNPCPIKYEPVPGYIDSMARLAVHNLVVSIADCEKICEKMADCQAIQFDMINKECVTHDGMTKLGPFKKGHQVCKIQKHKCTTPLITKADRNPNQESIQEGEKVIYTCTGTPRAEMVGNSVNLCTNKGFATPLPVCKTCCDSIELKFKIGMDHLDDIGYYDKYLLQADLKNNHVWYKSLSGKFSFWRAISSGKEVWALGETITEKIVAQLEADGCPYELETLDHWQWKTPLRMKDGKQQRGLGATFKASCGAPTSDILEIFTLPVGQGDSTIIKCPNSGEHIIVDMGSLKKGEIFGVNSAAAKLEYVKQTMKVLSQPTHTVTHVFLSHPDGDHLNYGTGLKGLIQALAAKTNNIKFYFGGSEAQWIADGQGALIAYVRTNFNLQNPQFILPAGMPTLNLCGTAVQMEILTGGNGNNHNSKSFVLMLKRKNFAMMFMGDLEGNAIYKTLISSKRTGLQADIILAPHHGSDTVATDGTIKSFFSFVKPRCVFISSHINKNYGHPRISTLNNVCYREDDNYYYLNHKPGVKNGQGWDNVANVGTLNYGSCDPAVTEIFQTTERIILNSAYPTNVKFKVLYAWVDGKNNFDCKPLDWVY